MLTLCTEIYKILNQGKAKADEDEELMNVMTKEEKMKQEQYIKQMATSHKDDQSIKIKQKGYRTEAKKKKKEGCCK